MIKSIMSRSVVTVRRRETIKNTVKKMASKAVSCIVITEKRIPIGIFTEHDLLGVLISGVDMNKTEIKSVMRTPVAPIEGDKDYFLAARRMKRMAIRRFIVVNDEDKLCGIVTATNIIKSFAVQAFSYRMILGAVVSKGATATPNTSLGKIAQTMVEKRQHCVAILKNRKPLGVITTFQLVKLAARYREPLKAKAGERMIKNIAVADTAGSLRESVLQMLKKNRHNILAVDDRGWYCGLVSQNELVNFIEKSQS